MTSRSPPLLRICPTHRSLLHAIIPNHSPFLLILLLIALLLPPLQVLAQDSPTLTTSISPSSTSGSGAAGATGLTVESGNSNDTWPRLFDSTSISANSSSESCPAFFSKFLADQVFLDCLPLSGLLLVWVPLGASRGSFFLLFLTRVRWTELLELFRCYEKGDLRDNESGRQNLQCWPGYMHCYDGEAGLADHP